LIPFFPPRFELAGVTLDWWLILVVLGVAAATEYGRARAIRRGLSVKLTVDGILFLVAIGFLFGHLVYHLVYHFDDLQKNWKLLLPWYGGYASTGGFIGSGLAIWFFYKVWKKTPIWAYTDNLAFAFTLGWGIGRFGCFTAHDHKGNPTEFFLGVKYPHADIANPVVRADLPENWWHSGWIDRVDGTELFHLYGTRHDLGLYESLLAFALLGLFIFLDRRERFHGFFSGLLLIGYAPVRFLMDFMRARDLPKADIRHFGLTPAQYGALILFGIGCWMLLHRRNKGRQDTSGEVARDYPGGTIPGQQSATEPAPDGSAGLESAAQEEDQAAEDGGGSEAP